eukprot:TRINITY_DN3918_c0_g1_i1.p1 TRINITY_DN3918_c0_g1~~TRINITY_DN3918_c0_g1_i1.p1  ORF type:complete len:197 (+),score=47.31 TRINITY_DN3918_c0_g1_i1:97-687(+)
MDSGGDSASAGDNTEIVTAERKKKLDALIRTVPHFPKEGINFKDISPLLANAEGLKLITSMLADHLRDKGIDFVAGMEARGFLVGAPLAIELNCGFIMLRKPSKLPGERISVHYGKEYGTDVLEVSAGLIQDGQKVVVVDDLIATGGTAAAACQLIRKAGGVVIGSAFWVELGYLPGRSLLENDHVPVFSVLTYAE